MCLILLSFDPNGENPLILAANRDEFYDRPARALGFWPEAPHILGGKDIRGGGSWMGITRTGRFAALTNYRDPSAVKEGTPSRGLLVKNFLAGSVTPFHYLEQIQKEADRFNPFNLLTGDRFSLYYFSNRDSKICKLAPGVHGLSNHLLDTPWPKVQKGKSILEALLKKQKNLKLEDIFSILADRTLAPDDRLPDTGVGLEKERLLSPAFIISPDYGTRSATALIVYGSGHVTMAERTFEPPAGRTLRYNTRIFRLKLIESSLPSEK